MTASQERKRSKTRWHRLAVGFPGPLVQLPGGCPSLHFWIRRLGLQHLRIADNYGPLYDVLKFPNISRPSVGFESLKRSLVYCADPLSRLAGISVDEVLNQERDIISSFPQRWYFNRETFEPVVQIASECTIIDGRLQVPVGRGDYANIGVNYLVTSYSLKIPVPEARAREQFVFRQAAPPISSRKIVPLR